MGVLLYCISVVFQSTRPSRASTPFKLLFTLLKIYFNPQGPRGPRRIPAGWVVLFSFISIHKALAGLDELILSHYGWQRYFNPQGPRGPRRNPAGWMVWLCDISIHKALAGLDYIPFDFKFTSGISIHKALAGLDGMTGRKEIY